LEGICSSAACRFCDCKGLEEAEKSIHVYDSAGNVIETPEHAGDFK
jgi:hypothetical protein